MSTVEPPRPPTPPSLPATSRYVDTEISTIVIDGEQVNYLRRRFVPPPEAHSVTHEREVRPADRLDVIAAEELGDAELWWQVADANGATRPADLTDRAGRRLRIAAPFGVPGEAP